MKNAVEISYATIDVGSEDELYEVPYGEPVGGAEAYRWVTAPPKAIRDHLKPGMILAARDKPYRVIGFGVVQEDGSILSRSGEHWLSDGKKFPDTETNFIENVLFKNIGKSESYLWHLRAEKPLFNPQINNRHWSKQWSACTASNPVGLSNLSRMYSFVSDSTLLTSRIVSDILRAVVKSYSKEMKQPDFGNDMVSREIKDELIAADQASNILNAYVEGGITYDQFQEICKGAYEYSKSNPSQHVFSLSPIEGMLKSLEGDLDTWANRMDDRFNGGSAYEGRKIIVKIMKDDIGLNNLLYKAMLYSMIEDAHKAGQM